MPKGFHADVSSGGFDFDNFKSYVSTRFNKYVYNKFDYMSSVIGQNNKSKHEYTKRKTDEGYAIEKGPLTVVM